MIFMNIVYKLATPADLRTVTELGLLLHTEYSFEGLLDEYRQVMSDGNQVIFLALDDDKAVGFAHCSLRHDYVEGTSGGTIGYLEGIYVAPEYRLNGVAKALVGEGERWASGNGCAEFASDCLLDNTDGYKFHLKIGFKEANRIICFTKDI